MGGAVLRAVVLTAGRGAVHPRRVTAGFRFHPDVAVGAHSGVGAVHRACIAGAEECLAGPVEARHRTRRHRNAPVSTRNSHQAGKGEGGAIEAHGQRVCEN